MMTSPIGTNGNGRRGTKARGLTLIELILVMAVLAVVALASVPRLSRFMQGRALREEAIRFLAVTQYARNTAINEGAATRLWIDPASGEYGVYPLLSGETTDQRTRTYQLGPDFRFEFCADPATDDGRRYVTYWSDGTLEEGSETLVRIAAEGGGAFEARLSERDAVFELRRPDEYDIDGAPART